MTDINITVGFSTSNAIVSKLIRWITRSKVSHAWIAYDDQTLGMRMVMQAEAWGFEVRPLKRWVKENKLVAEFVPVGDDLHSSFHYIAKKLGTKYDYKSALLTGLKFWVNRWFKIIKSRSFKAPNKLMCSEAVVRFLQHGGYKTVDGLDPELTSPGELLKLISKSEEFILVGG